MCITDGTNVFFYQLDETRFIFPPTFLRRYKFLRLLQKIPPLDDFSVHPTPTSFSFLLFQGGRAVASKSNSGRNGREIIEKKLVK